MRKDNCKSSVKNVSWRTETTFPMHLPEHVSLEGAIGPVYGKGLLFLFHLLRKIYPKTPSRDSQEKDMGFLFRSTLGFEQSSFWFSSVSVDFHWISDKTWGNSGFSVVVEIGRKALWPALVVVHSSHLALMTSSGLQPGSPEFCTGICSQSPI